MIDSFRDKYRFLSNFWPAVVCFEDNMDARMYPTVEHAYQAAKSLSVKVRREIAALPKAGEAKAMGNKLLLRKDWELVKVQVMRGLVRQKFFLYKNLADMLLATGTEDIIEGNTWNDKFWGCVKEVNESGKEVWVGENHLGKILMAVRKELK